MFLFDTPHNNLTMMANTNNSSEPRGRTIARLIQDVAAKLVAKEEPWAKYDIPSIPAERIIRHLYDPELQQWSTDETIVKIEKEPFTHGAMRFCYRMKKRAQHPKSATNHRFHKSGWSRASNYVAKCYQTDGIMDTSVEAKQAVQNDIMLQYEAQHWASKFNEGKPPTKVHFIRAYAIEFPGREGQPWMAVERFIEGRDAYGAGFVKHNTNSGFVDTDLRRVTPQVFSAHSFYASEGQRLVADIQGFGDLCTSVETM
jgi:elongation factor 2 kinase